MQKIRVIIVILVCCGVWKFAESGNDADDVAVLVAGVTDLTIDGHAAAGVRPLPAAEAEERQADQCSICFEAYDEQFHRAVTLPCSVQRPLAHDHKFCFACLQDWLVVRAQSACPLCRTAVLPSFKKAFAIGPAGLKLWLLLTDLTRCNAAGQVDEAALLRASLRCYEGSVSNIPVDEDLAPAAQFTQRLAMVEYLLNDSRRGGEDVDGEAVIWERFELDDSLAQREEVIKFFLTCAVREDQSVEQVMRDLQVLLAVLRRHANFADGRRQFKDHELKENCIRNICSIVMRSCGAREHKLAVKAMDVLQAVVPFCSRQQAHDALDDYLLPKFWSLLQAYRKVRGGDSVASMAALLTCVAKRADCSGSRLAAVFCKAIDLTKEADDDLADLIRVLDTLVSDPHPLSFSSQAREMMYEKIVDRFSCVRVSKAMGSAVTALATTLNQPECCVLL